MYIYIQWCNFDPLSNFLKGGVLRDFAGCVRFCHLRRDPWFPSPSLGTPLV